VPGGQPRQGELRSSRPFLKALVHESVRGAHGTFWRLNLLLSTPKPVPAGPGGEPPEKTPKRSAASKELPARLPTSPLAMLAGNYTGTWESKTLADVFGIATMTVAVEGDVVHAEIFLTGSQVMKDTLTGRAMKLGENVWIVEFKAERSQLRATSIFKDGRFDGDYTYYPTPEFADRGTWNLRKVAKTKN